MYKEKLPTCKYSSIGTHLLYVKLFLILKIKEVCIFLFLHYLINLLLVRLFKILRRPLSVAKVSHLNKCFI